MAISNYSCIVLHHPAMCRATILPSMSATKLPTFGHFNILINQGTL